jgi:hypothetical protein
VAHRRSVPGPALPARPALLPGGSLARNAQLAGMSSRLTGAYAANRARRVFASEERRAELEAELQLRTAEEVAATLGNLKGALMKLGQMVSYVDETLPEPLRESLASLQQDAPPMSPELAASVVEQELGGPPDRPEPARGGAGGRGRRRSGTSPPRPSTGSSSGACTGCTSSTATPTRATTCSARAAGSPSSTSAS